jgi:hypothetical protein
MRGNAEEKLMRQSYDEDLRSRHSTKRMHAVQGLWNPSSLTRGPWVPGAALASHSRPSDMRGTQG